MIEAQSQSSHSASPICMQTLGINYDIVIEVWHYNSYTQATERIKLWVMYLIDLSHPVKSQCVVLSTLETIIIVVFCGCLEIDLEEVWQ